MSAVVTAGEGLALELGKALLNVLVEKLSVEEVVRFLFETNGDRVTEMLRTEYRLNDVAIEELKKTLLGPRPA